MQSKNERRQAKLELTHNKVKLFSNSICILNDNFASILSELTWRKSFWKSHSREWKVKFDFKKNLIPLCKGHLNASLPSYPSGSWSSGQRTTDTQWEFFSNILNILANWAERPNELWGILGDFGWYYMLKCCYCVSLVIDFALLNHFFCKKAKIFMHFTLFSIWNWDMDLGFRQFEI